MLKSPIYLLIEQAPTSTKLSYTSLFRKISKCAKLRIGLISRPMKKKALRSSKADMKKILRKLYKNTHYKGCLTKPHFTNRFLLSVEN